MGPSSPMSQADFAKVRMSVQWFQMKATRPESWIHRPRGCRANSQPSTDLEKSSEAVVEILLPIAAAALGITVLGIVLNLVRAGIIQASSPDGMYLAIPRSTYTSLQPMAGIFRPSSASS